jgi:nucleotide-binding universal stress UspA family protein
MLEIKRILVPTDFGESAQCALRYACEFASRFGAELRVLHVQKDSVPYHGYDIDCPEEIKKQLDECPEKICAGDLNVSRAVRVGPPAAEIVQEAADWPADLIVMGTQGSGPLKHLFVGSVAEKVVRQSSCPVLVMRAKE